jgi:hypothetical protein
MSRVYSEDQLLEISLDDHVLDRHHCDLKEGSIGGVGEVAVDFSCGGTIEGHKFLHKVCAGLLRAGGVTRKIREAKFGDRAGSYLLLEDVDLV